MLLRTRILGLFALAILLVAASVALPGWLVLRNQEERIIGLRIAAQEGEVREALDHAARPLTAAARALAADPAILAALEEGNQAALRSRLAALQEEGGPLAGMARADIIGGGGQLLASTPGAPSEEALVSAETVLRELRADGQASGLEREPGGRMLLVGAARLPQGGLIAVAADAEDAFRGIGRALHADLFLTDRHDRPLFATASATWPLVERALAAYPAGAATLDVGGRTYRIVPTTLANSAGAPIGRLLVLRDATAEARRHALVLLLAGALLAVAATTVCAVLYRTIRATLDPLTGLAGALRALAGGDIYASAPVPERSDEMGEIAQALEALRATGLMHERQETRDRLARAQHQALIRQEMARLAAVLEGAEREEIMALLRRAQDQAEAAGTSLERAGSALALAFERMSAQVIAKHRQLAELLEARTRDLDIVRQALAERMQLNRLREELEVARQLQLSSLPAELPSQPEFRLHAAMLPAKEVGGDFYDFALLDGQRLALFIGDASGKGVGAAIFIAMARSLLRSAISRGASPAEALAQANDALAVDNATMMFATAFVGILDLPTGRLRFASAGHNAPRLRRADGTEGMLHGPEGIALGIAEGFSFDDREALLGPGDVLLLYTDGVPEAVGPGGGLFGDDRLAKVFSAPGCGDPRAVIESVGAAVAEFAGEEQQADDITMLCLHYSGNHIRAEPEEGRFVAAA